MDRAELRWREFLFDEVAHPAQFEQHLLIFDFIEDTTVPDLPANFNRFMTGAITLDIVGSKQSLMTFAKLGRFCIFGHIQRGPVRWENTKVHVRDGVIRPGKYTVPAGLLDLFKEKAIHADQAMEKISPTQREKIDAHITKNLDQFRGSDQFKAIEADLRMFGEDAVISKQK